MENFRAVVVGDLGVNCYLILDPDASRLLVIDPGDDADLILAAAKSFAFERTAILLTHAHVDHIGALPEVAAELHPEFVYLAAGDHALYHSPENAILPFLPAVQNLPEVTAEWSLEYPVRIASPGHSPGGSAFYFPKLELVLTGDSLFAGSVGRTDFPGGDFPTLEKSIRENLFALPEETRVYPGHGPASTIGREKSGNPYLA